LALLIRNEHGGLILSAHRFFEGAIHTANWACHAGMEPRILEQDARKKR
jgi:hypothetical protein